MASTWSHRPPGRVPGRIARRMTGWVGSARFRIPAGRRDAPATLSALRRRTRITDIPGLHASGSAPTPVTWKSGRDAQSTPGIARREI